jgi:chaperone modulatory protein CbpM
MTETLLRISLEELCQLEEIESNLVIEIVEYGIAKPIEGQVAAEWVFDTTSVHWIKAAIRLYQDFEIDWIAVAMVIDLLQQRESLQRENERYQQQLSRFLSDSWHLE